MFCLRSWLPLLFIPTNASPLFLLSFITLSYSLHRPCIYCSALLLILFLSSCHWADHCFLDLHRDWLAPRFVVPPPSPGLAATATATSAVSGTKVATGTGTGAGAEAVAEAAAIASAANCTGASSAPPQYTYYAYNPGNAYGYASTLNPTPTANATAPLTTFIADAVDTTATALASAIVNETKQHLSTGAGGVSAGSSTAPLAQVPVQGVGLGWLRSLVGRWEWTLPCVRVKVRL